MDQVSAQAVPARSAAAAVFGGIAFVIAALGLFQCAAWSFGVLSPRLPGPIWIWIDFHGLEWWAFAIGAGGPLVAGLGAILGGIVAFVAKLGRKRARAALLAVILGVSGLVVFAAAWISTSIWLAGA